MGKNFIFICIGFVFLTLGCRKDLVFQTQSVNLSFSEDTIFLDTVFTTIGSSTRILKVKNPSDENILISNVRLGKGNSSFYRMNVDGASTKNISEVELLANDSVYIFIEVTADVAGSNSLLYTDSIIFNTGGNIQNVQLVTLARDAHFHYPNAVFVIPQPAPYPEIRIPYRRLGCNEIWTDDKPHVVYGYAVVDSLCTLTIEPGAEVNFHSGSGLMIWSGGKLLIDPSKTGDIDDNFILMQGDRLEPSYENIPGQWGGLFGGIWFMQGSVDNQINNCIIKNSTTALRVDSSGNQVVNLKIKDSFIMNNSRVGVYGGFANLEAENVVMANNGVYSFYALGGNYNFLHCTFANYWNQSSRSTPSIGLVNFFQNSKGNNEIREIENAYFGNCIVYGNNTSEFGVGKLSGGDLNYKFVNGLLKLDRYPQDNSYDVNDPNFFLDCILNADPNFVDAFNLNYALDTLSPAMDAGNSNDGVLVPFDILQVSRPFGTLPDIGAYERVE